jgi:hypothetical protein
MKLSMLLPAVLAAVLLVGCGGSPSQPAASPSQPSTPTGTSQTPTPPPADTVQVVNSICPIMGNPIDKDRVPADLAVDFHGQKVGFCCGGCPGQWNALTDAQKQEKLQAAMATPAPPPAG